MRSRFFRVYPRRSRMVFPIRRFQRIRPEEASGERERSRETLTWHAGEREPSLVGEDVEKNLRSNTTSRVTETVGRGSLDVYFFPFFLLCASHPRCRVAASRAGAREEQNWSALTPARSTSESPASPTYRDAGGAARRWLLANPFPGQRHAVSRRGACARKPWMEAPAQCRAGLLFARSRGHCGIQTLPLPSLPFAPSLNDDDDLQPPARVDRTSQISSRGTGVALNHAGAVNPPWIVDHWTSSMSLSSFFTSHKLLLICIISIIYVFYDLYYYSSEDINCKVCIFYDPLLYC